MTDTHKSNFIKISILGDRRVGKTSYSLLLTGTPLYNNMDYYDPPCNQAYTGNVKLNDDDGENGELYEIEITDQFSINDDQYSNIFRDEWIKKSMGFILMYSIKSRESFNKIKEYKELIELIFDRDLDSFNNIPPMLLIGNKSDNDDNDETRQISYQEGKELSISLGISSFIEVSSKSNNSTKNINQSKFEIINLVNDYKIKLLQNNKIQKNKSKCKLM